LYAAFPRSEYHDPSDFPHLVRQPLAFILVTGYLVLRKAWDLPSSFIYLCYMPLSKTPGMPEIVSP